MRQGARVERVSEQRGTYIRVSLLLDVLVGEAALAGEDDRRRRRGDLGRLVVALFWAGARGGEDEARRDVRTANDVWDQGAKTHPNQTWCRRERERKVRG
jgi:hypothetical protein